MKTIFETCVPRDEVLRNDLRDEMFAARLKDVVDRSGDDLYVKPADFFANTYVTDGLRTLAREVAGRLSGEAPSSSPFIRLETSFGGGKTHNLIALLHMAREGAKSVPTQLVEPAWLKGTPWPVAGVVGSDLDPSGGTPRGKVRVHTLWGEIAWQIGGAKAFAAVAEQDAQRVTPGSASLERIFGQGPALVMIDEIALHLRAAKGVSTANGQSDLAAQTVAFLMNLLEYAASRPRVVVVLTLAERNDAFGAETEHVARELADLRRVSARHERILRPTAEAEVASIVNHRMFRAIDRAAAEETARAFHDALTQASSRGTDLPPRTLRPEYTAEFARSYPFHPELLATLERKTSTIPNFQRTRGALRLLAAVVRNVWAKRAQDAYVIAPHHVDLGDARIGEDLTSRLERARYRPVIEADIASSRGATPSHCDEIDRITVAAGRAPFARRIGTTVFLHSLVHLAAPGVERSELMLSVLQPGDDPELARQALEQMLGHAAEGRNACWYLHVDGARYWFKTEPSLEKVLQDEAASIGQTDVKNALEARVRSIWKKGAFVPVFFPAGPADVADDPTTPRLVVVHFDALAVDATTEAIPELLRGIFDYASAAQKFRAYKNHCLFLVVDGGLYDAMLRRMRRSLAVDSLLAAEDRLKDLTDVQIETLKKEQQTGPLEVRVAVTRAYRHLYFPQSAGEGLARAEVPVADQGRVEDDQSAVILKVLREHDKVITADPADMPAPAFVRQRAWPANATSITTADLRREFARRTGLKILIDETQLKRCVRVGVEKAQWVYYDPAEKVGYGAKSPAPSVAISEEAVLYSLEEVAAKKIPIKGDEAPPEPSCPACGRPSSHCVCGDEDGLPPGGSAGGGGEGFPEPKTHGPFHAEISEKPVAHVFEALTDLLRDRGVERVARLKVFTVGAVDAKKLGLAIPQLGGGVHRVEQTATLTVDEGGDRLSLTFEGTPDRFKRVRQLTDAMGQEATQAVVRTSVEFRWPGGSTLDAEDFTSVRDVLLSVGVGTVALEADELAPSLGGVA